MSAPELDAVPAVPLDQVRARGEGATTVITQGGVPVLRLEWPRLEDGSADVREAHARIRDLYGDLISLSAYWP